MESLIFGISSLVQKGTANNPTMLYMFPPKLVM